MTQCIRDSLAGLTGVTLTLLVAPARAQSFALADEYALPQTGVVWTSADFDADGDTDLAIVTNDGAVATAFNDGHGAFSITSSLAGVPIGSNILPGFTQTVAGDFNGDGALDVLVSSSRVPTSGGEEECEATLLLNRGDGTFVFDQSIPATSELSNSFVGGCTGLAAADFDGDGRLDFALGLYSIYYGGDGLYGEVDVFHGNGDATFTAPTVSGLLGDNNAPGPWVSYAMAEADFDADGKPDLAFGENVVYLSGPGAQRLQVLSGDGALHFTPTFTETTTTPLVTTFMQARAADVTSDGRLDLLLLAGPGVSGGFGPQDTPLLLATNTGSGTLSPANLVASEFGAVGFESADFDGDAKPDLLLASAEDRAAFFRGDGYGNYLPSAAYATGGAIAASLAADFDADGQSDFAVLDASRPAFRVALAEPEGAGFALPRVTPLSTLGDQVEFSPGDYDGDGKLDLLASEYGAFDVMLGAGDGTFTLATHLASDTAPARPLVADLNHDGLTDFVVPAAGATLRTLFGSSDGSFSGTTSVDTGSSGEMGEGAFGDFDDDGDLDVAVFWVTSLGSPPEHVAAVRLYANDGSGNFSFVEELPSTSVPSRLSFADLNGDGHWDLFVGSAPVELQYNDLTLSPGDSLSWLGDGSGGFTREVALPAASSQFELGDVNGDERLDLMTDTDVVLGLGDGRFGAPTAVSASGRYVSLADLDGDGALDLVTLDTSSLGFALGNGDGTFDAPESLFGTTSNNPLIAFGGVADLTGDDAPDLFFGRLPRLGYDERAPELVSIVSQTEAPPPVSCPPPHHHFPHLHRPHQRPFRDFPHFGWPSHSSPRAWSNRQ